LARLLADKSFLLLLLGSVVPFALLQTGMISFALPIYLANWQASAADVGRVLLLYGLFIAYAGPFLGRLTDNPKAPRKRWIAIGNSIAAGGMLCLAAFSGLAGLAGATLAVLAFAAASCFLVSAQSAYLLGLPAAQALGAAASTSLLRTADKFGQMLGPMLFGLLFSLMPMPRTMLCLTLACLAAMAAFALFAPGGRPKPLAA
jgi:MFS family permease